MSCVKFAVFLSLLVCIAGARNAPKLGYLFLNGSRPAHCYDLTANEICPSDLVDYQVMGFDRGQELPKYELLAVKIEVQVLDFAKVSQKCRYAYRTYQCSNTFAVCKPSSKYGVKVEYDYQKTKAACKSMQTECPLALAQDLTFNCSLIQKDITGYTYCESLPDVAGDVCAKSNYKYPAALGKFYKASASSFIKTLEQMTKAKLFTNATCMQEFVGVYCQLMRNTICSTDQSLRMFAISQQECAATYSKCLSSTVPQLKKYFLETCKLFPDANTAKRVPLPSAATK